MQEAKRLTKPNKLLLALSAVALAVTAQWLLGRHCPWGGAFLYAVAVGLFVLALGWRPGPLAPAPRLASGRRPWALGCLGVALLSVGAVIGLSSLCFFSSPAGVREPWLWYLAGAALLLLGAAVLDLGRGRVPGEERWSRRQLWLLLGLLALAALVRLWNLEGLPFGTWYDEAENGLAALGLLGEPAYRPVYEARVNSAGHYLLLLSWCVRLFGASTFSIRLVSALMGTVSVAAGYLVGREMFGRRWGLVVAFLLAVSRWSINFSRIGMYNVSTPLFELMALGFLLRGLRRRRYLDFALSGLGLGLGIVFYTGFLPFPVLLLAFLLRTAVAERDALRGNWRGLAVLGLVAFLIVSPVAQYAAGHGETFFERARKTSVFKGKSGEEALLAVGQSTIKYLLLFNYRGDRYGRHNLSGEPMLDPLSGALLVLGLGLCLRRWRRPRSLLLPLWLLAMLVPGIFSLEWEAPHALRTIGALAPACLLATAVLHDLAKEWCDALGRRARVTFWLAAGLALGVVGCSNLHTYFLVQARDYESWRDFSTAETITARLMAQLGNSVEYYVISYYHGHPVVRFLAPQVTEYRRIETHEDLPLPDVASREVVIVLDGRTPHLVEQARRYYPRAAWQEYTSPSGGPPVTYVLRLSPEDAAGIQGLVGYYREGEEGRSVPAMVRREDLLSFQWSDGVPLYLPFRAEWKGVLRAPEYGPYRLLLQAPDRVELYLDGTLVMEGLGTAEAEVLLARGNHALRIEAVGGEGRFEFRWQPRGGEEEVVPSWALYTSRVTSSGLLARYFPNGEWESPAAFSQIDSQVGFYYHIPPLPMPYTAEWEGRILIPESGRYVFAIQSIDESVLYLNGQEIAAAHRDEYAQAVLDLEAGYHDLLLRYAARTDHMYVYLYWTPPGGTCEIIPAEVLFPAEDSWQPVTSAPGEH